MFYKWKAISSDRENKRDFFSMLLPERSVTYIVNTTGGTRGFIYSLWMY